MGMLHDDFDKLPPEVQDAIGRVLDRIPEGEPIDPAVYRFADAANEVIALVSQGISAFAFLAENSDSEALQIAVREVAEGFRDRLEQELKELNNDEY